MKNTKNTKKIFKTLIAGAMACIMALPVNMIASNARVNTSKDYETITGLVNIAAKNEEEYIDCREWMKVGTTHPRVSDISETMDYCNPLVSKNYYCIDLDGKEYPATTEDYRKAYEDEHGYSEGTLSQVDVLSTSYNKFIKKNQDTIGIDNDSTRLASEQALRIASGYEAKIPDRYHIWTYNGYAPEQSSKHQESMDKWKEARQILKDFCKENKYVIYGFAFAIPNVNYSEEDIKNKNYMSWRDMQGTYVLLYSVTDKDTFHEFFADPTNIFYTSLPLSEIEESTYSGPHPDFDGKAFPNDYLSTSYRYYKPTRQENSMTFSGFGPDWQDGVNYLGTGDTKLLSLLQYTNEPYSNKHCVTKYTGPVEWTSSNEKVATVSNGAVTAIKAGVTTITAKCNGTSFKYRLSVFNRGKKTEKATYTSKKRKKIVVRLKDMSGVESVRWNNPYGNPENFPSGISPKFYYKCSEEIDGNTEKGFIWGQTNYYETNVTFTVEKAYYKNYAKKLKKGITFKMNALVTYKDGSTETIYYNLVFKK